MAGSKRPFVCRIGLHRWQFVRPLISGSGCIEVCTRYTCPRTRITHWAGLIHYFDREIPNVPQCRQCGGPAPHRDPCSSCQLANLADAMVDDIVEMSDEEILVEQHSNSGEAA